MSLIELREEVNEIDNKIMKLIVRRFDIALDIGKYKIKNKLLIEDKKREEEIINSRINSSKLSENFVRELFNLIFEESKHIQRKVK